MAAAPKDVRARLDAVDLHLLALLQADGRTPNNVLAERAGIAPSTCLNRVRRLREVGAIRGVHAEVDPAWLGRPVQAMIAVRLRPDARGALQTFARSVAELPEVLNVYFVSGSYDFLMHVATADTEALRRVLVEDVSGRPVVASTETHLIFEHVRGTGAGRDAVRPPSGPPSA